MSPNELRGILMSLDAFNITQERLAALLGRAPRTIRHWVAAPAPSGPRPQS
jgi:hypothetical protein